MGVIDLLQQLPMSFEAGNSPGNPPGCAGPQARTGLRAGAALRPSEARLAPPMHRALECLVQVLRSREVPELSSARLHLRRPISSHFKLLLLREAVMQDVPGPSNVVPMFYGLHI